VYRRGEYGQVGGSLALLVPWMVVMHQLTTPKGDVAATLDLPHEGAVARFHVDQGDAITFFTDAEDDASTEVRLVAKIGRSISPRYLPRPVLLVVRL
jgi:hypothetical protein